MRHVGVVIAALLVLIVPVGAKPGKEAVGDFVLADGAVQGDWVSFSYGPDEVRDFTLGGVEVFDVEVERQPLGGSLEKRAEGARTEIRTTFFELEALDTPTGHLQLASKGPITFTFPDGAALAEGDGRVEVVVDGVRGVLVGESLAVDGSTVTTERSARFLAVAPGARDLTERVARAAAADRIGAVVSLARGEDGPKEAVASFGNVSVEPEVTDRHVRFVVDGDRGDARVLAFTIDPALLGNASDADIAYAFDAAPLPSAVSIQDVLDPDDDGLEPERWTVRDEAGLQLLVSVPHYSVHTVDVRALLAEAAPAIVAGVLAGLGAVALGGVALFRRRAA